MLPESINCMAENDPGRHRADLGLARQRYIMNLTIRAAIGAVVLPFLLSSAQAGPIERACNKSDREAANRSVCACIQQVADMSLSGADQRRAAKFFNDPDKAQDVRLSDTTRDDAFWARYMAFGEQAEAFCAF